MHAVNAEKCAAVAFEYAYVPKMINSEKEYKRAKVALERLLFPERKVSAEEDAMAKLLLHLIDLYESRSTVPLGTTSRQVLRHLMEQRGLRQADLTGVFGAVSVVSEILAGEREISAKQPRRLADRFDLTADEFIA
ncbi:MAG: type II toxin-antitoxin system HigA family antitoxin [Bryobacteraceae bacterium]